MKWKKITKGFKRFCCSIGIHSVGVGFVRIPLSDKVACKWCGAIGRLDRYGCFLPY
jgi:hypothetical protein